MGWPLVSVAGVEADDVIATLAKRGAMAGWEVIIASGDKDLMQLVDECVSVYDGMKERLYDGKGVLEKFAVHRNKSRIIWLWSVIPPTTLRACKKSAPKPPPSGLCNTNRWITLSVAPMN